MGCQRKARACCILEAIARLFKPVVAHDEILYSRPRVKLDSFKLPDNFHVRPVTASENRRTERGEHQDVCYIVNTVTGERNAILPAERIEVPLLILGLDQGSQGCAGAAFVMFWLHMMVLAKFDWIHRLIRDIKGAENGCCKKIFTKTKLWSAYLFSLRKRPFGSGTNATQMQCFAELFEDMCDIQSPIFEISSKAGQGLEHAVQHRQREANNL